MQRNKALGFAVIAAVMLFWLAPPARADFIVTFQQEGTNVVATGSGSLNLGGLTPLAASCRIN